MKVNNKIIKGDKFAFDNCHKIYIIESEQDLIEAKEMGYDIYDINYLPTAYRDSCELKFISNWQLDTQYVQQCEDAKFEFIK